MAIDRTNPVIQSRLNELGKDWRITQLVGTNYLRIERYGKPHWWNRKSRWFPAENYTRTYQDIERAKRALQELLEEIVAYRLENIWVPADTHPLVAAVELARNQHKQSVE